MQRIVVKGSIQTHSKPLFATQICGTNAEIPGKPQYTGSFIIRAMRCADPLPETRALSWEPALESTLTGQVRSSACVLEKIAFY